ncbi:MAG: hypothetical protein M1541_00685, partial [Acidobacteria bacterium]|nr:hypothetical protein [Acidobacteriota bacterium]
RVVCNLARAKDVEIERGGNGFRVSFTAFGGARVSHLLRMPSLKQIGQYKKGTCRPLDARNNVTRLRISLQPAEDLYDAIIENVEGYKSKVPVVHKAAVAVQVRADLDAIAEEMDPE